MGHIPYPRYVSLCFASGGILSADNLGIIIKISFGLDDRHCYPFSSCGYSIKVSLVRLG